MQESSSRTRIDKSLPVALEINTLNFLSGSRGITRLGASWNVSVFNPETIAVFTQTHVACGYLFPAYDYRAPSIVGVGCSRRVQRK